MSFKRGDTCFILENNEWVVQAKIMSKQDSSYFVQLVGSCGALKLPESRLFKTAAEAEAGKKTSGAIVHVQLSDTKPSDFPKIPDAFDGKV